MGEPMKCKYCGADAIAHDNGFVNGWRAACGSWDFGYGLWSRGEGCYLRSKVAECDELRKQVREAVKRLEELPRYWVMVEANRVAEIAGNLKKAVGDA